MRVLFDEPVEPEVAQKFARDQELESKEPREELNGPMPRSKKAMRHTMEQQDLLLMRQKIVAVEDRTSSGADVRRCVRK
jgi:hypothetical protein